jgi:hypothetical protein
MMRDDYLVPARNTVSVRRTHIEPLARS